MNKLFKTVTAAAFAALAALAVTGCTSSVSSDQNATNNQLTTFQKNQPVPYNTFSQYRQTMINVEQAEIHGTATTSFFYNMGSNVPLKSCPSTGFPVPSDAELTNPTQAIGNGAVVDQSDPTGVYSGPSTGTYVVCVTPDGQQRINYWEGYVETEGGAAHFDKASGQIVDDGGTTVKVAKR